MTVKQLKELLNKYQDDDKVFFKHCNKYHPLYNGVNRGYYTPHSRYFKHNYGQAIKIKLRDSDEVVPNCIVLLTDHNSFSI